MTAKKAIQFIKQPHFIVLILFGALLVGHHYYSQNSYRVAEWPRYYLRSNNQSLQCDLKTSFIKDKLHYRLNVKSTLIDKGKPLNISRVIAQSKIIFMESKKIPLLAADNHTVFCDLPNRNYADLSAYGSVACQSDIYRRLKYWIIDLNESSSF